MRLSVVIRTLHAARHLPDLLKSIGEHEFGAHTCEMVLVDSGSTDGTAQIAESHHCNIFRISKADFSFGCSLNVGCAAAAGDALVFVSGHCIPYDRHWLARLVEPLQQPDIAFSYGRQIGGETSHFSEPQIFAKYFPSESRIPQDGFYCNNANSASLRSDWEALKFDEELTGLEDVDIAKART